MWVHALEPMWVLELGLVSVPPWVQELGLVSLRVLVQVLEPVWVHAPEPL
jgi:hypothetical protein